MARDQTQTCDAFDPEEVGIMLDRLASELVHAQAKNPPAVPNLKQDALELLSWTGGWFTTCIEPDHRAIDLQVTATVEESLAIAQALRDVADQLLLLAEIAENRPGEG